MIESSRYYFSCIDILCLCIHNPIKCDFFGFLPDGCFTLFSRSRTTPASIMVGGNPVCGNPWPFAGEPSHVWLEKPEWPGLKLTGTPLVRYSWDITGCDTETLFSVMLLYFTTFLNKWYILFNCTTLWKHCVFRMRWQSSWVVFWQPPPHCPLTSLKSRRWGRRGSTGRETQRTTQLIRWELDMWHCLVVPA